MTKDTMIKPWTPPIMPLINQIDKPKDSPDYCCMCSNWLPCINLTKHGKRIGYCSIIHDVTEALSLCKNYNLVREN